MTDRILSVTAGKAGKLAVHTWRILECRKHKMVTRQQKQSLLDTNLLTWTSAYFYIQDRSLTTNRKGSLSICPQRSMGLQRSTKQVCCC